MCNVSQSRVQDPVLWKDFKQTVKFYIISQPILTLPWLMSLHSWDECICGIIGQFVWVASLVSNGPVLLLLHGVLTNKALSKYLICSFGSREKKEAKLVHTNAPANLGRMNVSQSKARNTCSCSIEVAKNAAILRVPSTRVRHSSFKCTQGDEYKHGYNIQELAKKNDNMIQSDKNLKK